MKTSSFGPSFWFDTMWCLKRYDLAQQNPEVDLSGSGTHIGSIFHQFAAKYHGNRDIELDFLPNKDSGDKASV